MTTVHEQGENWISCVKGAPDVILKRCRYEMEEDENCAADQGEADRD